MSENCDGSVGPKYKKTTQVRTLFDGTEVQETVHEEVGLICLGCFKEPCEEDAKKGWTHIDFLKARE